MRPTSAIERVCAWVIALAVTGSYLLIAARHGALGIPRNDDWSYLRVALDLAEAGQVHLTGWVQMFFLGQAVLAQPVIALTSGSITALQLFVAALGAASLILAYDLIRRVLPPALAALAVLPVALGPMFGSLAVSFMTDIPALFLTLVTLSFGAAALTTQGRKKSLLLVTAAATGLLAFTIREYGLLAWISVAITAIWQTSHGSPAGHKRRELLKDGLLLVVSMLVAFGLWVWRAQVPGTLPTGIDVPQTVSAVNQALGTLCAALITLGIFIAPAICAISPVKLFRVLSGRVRMAAALVAGVLLIALAARGPFPIGNMLTAFGNYPDTIIGTRDIPLLADWVVSALAVIGLLSLLLSGLVLASKATAAVQSSLPPESPTLRLLAIYLGLTGLLMMGFALLLDQLWDRYLLAIIPCAAGLLLVAARSRGLIVSPRWAVVPTLAVATFAVLGVVFADRAATIDGASWAVAQAAVSRGERPDLIDGGFAWNGTWQPGRASWPAPLIPGQPWWRALYPDSGYCTQVEVTSSPPIAQSPHAPALATQTLQTQTLLGTQLWFAVVPNPAAADYSDTLPQC